jgi:hypothetical protein
MWPRCHTCRYACDPPPQLSPRLLLFLRRLRRLELLDELRGVRHCLSRCDTPLGQGCCRVEVRCGAGGAGGMREWRAAGAVPAGPPRPPRCARPAGHVAGGALRPGRAASAAAPQPAHLAAGLQAPGAAAAAAQAGRIASRLHSRVGGAATAAAAAGGRRPRGSGEPGRGRGRGRAGPGGPCGGRGAGGRVPCVRHAAAVPQRAALRRAGEPRLGASEAAQLHA